MNDQCHDCRIRKSCYFEEPEEDWTCDSYKPCEYDEYDDTDNDADVVTVDLDKAISETAYVLECIATLKSIQESGNCNDCADRDCIYRPKLGRMVRYNCMFFKGKKHE